MSVAIPERSKIKVKKKINLFSFMVLLNEFENFCSIFDLVKNKIV